MAAWQGPALLIYNNADFSEKDFNAICRLGVGSKSEDTSKIGRHGLGFNSVYHFTDVPSIVSGPYLGFFDPHMTNLPPTRGRNGAPIAKGGHRCDFRKLSKEILSDQLDPYKDIFDCDMTSHFKGTIFRLPLRLKGSKALSQSGFTDEGWTLVQIEKMLEEWIKEAKLGMLFMDNMESIHISDGSKPEVVVKKTATMLSKSSREDGAELSGLFDKAIPPAQRIFAIKITVESSDSKPFITESTSWMVCTDGTFPFGTPDEVRQLATKRHWSPHCGVAVPLDDRQQDDLLEGRLLVYLPTPIPTGLPFHIHGGFALTSNRKSLAGGQEKDNERHIWNNFLLERCLPEVALSAFEELLKYTFREPSLGGPRTQDLDQCIAGYFHVWPVKSSKVFELFVKKFVDQSNFRQVFPVRGSPSDVPMIACTGSSITMPGDVAIPPGLRRRIYGWLRKGSVLVSDVPPKIALLAKEAWMSSMFRVYHEIDGDAIRKQLRADPEFIPQQLKSQDEKRWMLEVVLKPVLDPASSVKELLTGLSIIPLRNGEWKGLFSNPEYYNATADVQNIIDAKDILLDSDLFLSKELNPILKALIASSDFGIRLITWRVFVSAFCSEHSDGVPEDKWNRIWKFLPSQGCPADIERLPILETAYGTMTTLQAAKDGLQITGSGSLEVVTALMDLFQDLGIVVFDAAKHMNHQYFKDHTLPYSDIRLVDLISQHWTPSDSRAFSTNEAMHLRRIILSNSDKIKNTMAARLGALPIWCTVGTRSEHLIAAAGARYLEGHFSMLNLGKLPTLLSEFNFKHFRAMGATPLTVTEALIDIVMPRFLNGELECVGLTKAAYVGLVDNLLFLSNLKGRIAQPARTVLSQGRCFLAQDGSFHTLSELLRPNSRVTQIVFADRQELFPDFDVYQRMVERGCTGSGLRTLKSDPRLIQECAEKVLAETTSPDANPEITRERAVQVIKYIYDFPSACEVDWMDARWKIVPRETNFEPPYDLHTPNLPIYMAFSSLVRLKVRNQTWTRLGFFPADLVPSSAFKTKFPEVWVYNMDETYLHLNTLVQFIAPTWRTTDQQHSLKALLFKIYKGCEDFAARSDTFREYTKDKLSKLMKVPYILNGNSKDPSDLKSWDWPTRLMFDIDQNISSHDVVDKTLHEYRTFLVAVGALEIQHVEGTIDVEDGRKLGDMEIQIRNCFETQDQDTGFMDVRFKFLRGSDILAHKVVLARTSDYFFRRFTGIWASISARDPKEPGVQIIDLSSYGDIKTGFWGLLYYFYSDMLIQSNGPPFFDGEKDEGSTSEGEVGDKTPGQGGDGSSEKDDNDAEVQATKDMLGERVEYLMVLQDVANRFEATRLKDLIAQELVMGEKIMHSNVFNIRNHAEQNQAANLKDHCRKFIEMNKSSVLKYVNGEIQVLWGSLTALGLQEVQEEDDEDDEDYVPSEDDSDDLSQESEDEDEGKEEFADCAEDGSEDSDESSSETKVKGFKNKKASGDGAESIDSDGEGSLQSSTDEEGSLLNSTDEEGSLVSSSDEEESLVDIADKEGDWEIGEDWEEASIEMTSDEDESSGTDSDEDDRSEDVDLLSYLTTISPVRAQMEEELCELNKNREELLALP
ncbi:hypothetical protein BGZ96_002274 [Linnemannia gamsii]|uniref:BTB domain-containing protein n=1 Tax=Linnemannia gamsii TaxID=64522 RepID=A0ABQ7JL14_9FUNG|nr:hypothetical protein BGZ96_002274 [Linnemannia gamsii]